MSSLERVTGPLVVRINRLDITVGVYQYLLLGVIILVAACLRFYKLGEWSFWGDEVLQLAYVSQMPDGAVANWSVSGLSMNAVLSLLGTSEWSARLVPALVGILSIPLLYFPIRRAFGLSVALVSVLLLALSPWHLYWSQNARFYTALLLFYNMGLLYFYLGIEESRRRYLVLAIIFLGLAFQERAIALLFLPVIASYLVIIAIFRFQKPTGLRLTNLLLVFALASVVVLYNLLPYLEHGFGMPQAQREWVNNNPFWLLAGVVYYIGLPMTVIGAVGAIYLLLQRSRAGMFLALSAVTPILAIMALSLVTYTANRYAFVSLLGWIILAGSGVVALFKVVTGSGRLLVLGILLLMVLDSMSENVLYFRYQNGNRDNWKDAFAYVIQHRSPGEAVYAGHPQIASYYLGEPVIPLIRLNPQQIEAEGTPVWFVEDMVVADMLPEKYQWIVENATLVENLDVHVRARNFKMRIYFYDPDNHHRR